VTSARAAFRALALERARAHPGVELALPHPDDLALDVVPTDGPAFRLSLHTLFARSRDASPEQRLRALDARIAAALSPAEVPPTWAEAAPRLRAVLRAASTLGPDLREHAARPCLPGLVLAAVIDHPHLVLHVSAAQARGWGQDRGAVVDAALGTTAALALEPWDEDAGLWCSDGLTAGAALLRPGAIAALEASLGGPVAVAIPGSDLLVVGPATPAGVGRLARTAAAEHGAAGQPVSPCLYSGTPLEPLRVAPEHPAFDALERARIQLWVDEVSSAAHARGVELELAAVRGEDGRLRTAVRSTGQTILPVAEITLDGPAPTGPEVPGLWPPWRALS
jgi:hypothetical protein